MFLKVFVRYNFTNLFLKLIGHFNVDGHNGGQVWRSGFVSQFWNLCLFDIEPHGIFVPTIHEIVKNLNNGIIASIIAKNIKFKHDGASGCGCARQQKIERKKVESVGD